MNALQPADACLLVVDLGDPDCVAAVRSVHEILSARRVELTGSWDGEGDDDDVEAFTVVLPALLVASKADLLPALDDELRVFEELSGIDYPSLGLSAETGDGLAELGRWLFGGLGIVRVYTKVPGQPPDMSRPYTVRRGQTVHDVAEQVHRDIAGTLRFARLWGEGSFDGQQVGAEHVVVDGDVVELHA